MTDEMRAREKAICKVAKVDDIGEVSDGFHTFNDLYEQRMILFAALVKAYKDKSWKSYRHEDGEYCFGGGSFIVGIDTPEGSYTYHYENKYWDMFDCTDLPRAKHWDGHTEEDAEVRLMSLKPERTNERTKTHACNSIDRQAAIDAINRAVTKEAAIRSVESLPSVQSEPCEDAEFWQKRAEYYSKICLDLIAGMNQGVKIDSIEINEERINFKMTKPEPCEDAVSRQQALDILDEYSGEVMEIQCNSYEKARLKMCKLPPAQPEETTATAIRTQDGDVMWYICDACNEPINIKDRFCGGCGRKVRWNE